MRWTRPSRHSQLGALSPNVLSDSALRRMAGSHEILGVLVIHRSEPVRQSALSDNPGSHPSWIFSHHIGRHSCGSGCRWRRGGVEPEIGSLGNASLLRRQRQEKSARRIADACEPDPLSCVLHRVEPKSVFGDITSAVVSDFDRIAELALHALRVRANLACLRLALNGRHKQSCEQDAQHGKAIFLPTSSAPVHRNLHTGFSTPI
jgi:hypothetical protein